MRYPHLNRSHRSQTAEGPVRRHTYDFVYIMGHYGRNRRHKTQPQGVRDLCLFAR